MAVGWLASLLLVVTMIGHGAMDAAAAPGSGSLASAMSLQVELTLHAERGHSWSEPNGVETWSLTSLPTDERCVTIGTGVLSVNSSTPVHEQAAPPPLPESAMVEQRSCATTTLPTIAPDVRRALIQMWLN